MKGYNNTRYKIISLIPIILLLIGIFSFSAQNGDKSGSTSYRICISIVKLQKAVFKEDWSQQQMDERAERLQVPVRKGAHMGEYALLAVLFCIHLNFYQLQQKSKIALSFLLTVLCAGVDEIHQLFVPARAGQFLDVLIDSVGAAAGIIFFVILYQFYKRKRVKGSRV